VEEELCSFIVNLPDAPSARIARHLEKIAVDNHFQDCQLCLHAVRSQRIKCGPSKNVSLFDTSQLTIATALEEQIKKSGPVNRLLNGLQREIRLLKAQLESLNAVLLIYPPPPPRGTSSVSIDCATRSSRATTVICHFVVLEFPS